MKHVMIILLGLLLAHACFAQEEINDEALRYQQQRMVYQQWDQNKFKPTSGFLGLNPYYWLVWGWPYPNYHKTDLRPLSATGPQTQRLALVAAMNSTDGKYKLQSEYETRPSHRSPRKPGQYQMPTHYGCCITTTNSNRC